MQQKIEEKILLQITTESRAFKNEINTKILSIESTIAEFSAQQEQNNK